MNEYKGLKYKTRGNASPQGKPRVYFCCQSDDFSYYFNPITKEILDIQLNAAIWYYDPTDVIPDDENFIADLSQMQLFVIPITSNFLYKDNHARTVEYSYAIKHHIPVLPLMQESGLESDFNTICGDLQFLDKNTLQKDSTALPYDEKLKTFLQSVLVSDELAKKIRDAFDAYIFLSYRKKDRKYAQQIMKLIHRNEFCRDIAIWYDEFLTPGENFNNAIAEAMNKSCLFALVVTPNLLENPNYVMTVEYPEARKLRKPVLPIEGKPTNHEELTELYEGIDPALTPEQLTEKLHKTVKNIALRENDSDPAHNFMIGLAYLSGIDVEVDHDRAVKLITSAAEANLPEAYKKLVSMYQNGEGIDRNYYTAIEWQYKYVEYLKGKYEGDGKENSLKILISELLALGEFLKGVSNLSDAKHVYQEMLNYSLTLENGFTKDPWVLSVCYEKIGDICRLESNLSEAREWHQKCLAIRKQLNEEISTVDTQRDLFTIIMKLADISLAEGNISQTKDWYNQGFEIIRKINDESKTVKSRRDLLISYLGMGDVCRLEANLSEATDWYQKGLEICQQIVEETSSIDSRNLLSMCYERMGYLYLSKGSLSEAKDWYKKYHEINQQLLEETETIGARQTLANSYERLGSVCKSEGNYSEAKDWYKKSLDLREKITIEINTVESRRNLSVSYSGLGDQYLTEGNLSEAKDWYKKGLEIRKEIAEGMRTVESRRDLAVSYERLGNIFELEGNYSEAKDLYIKGYEISKQLAEETDTIDSRRDLFISYEKLGNISQSEGAIGEAKKWFQKSLEVCRILLKETNTLESLRDLSVIYDRLGYVCELERNFLEAKAWCKKSLEIRIELAKHIQSVETRRDLFVSYDRLGDVCKAEGNQVDAKDWYMKALEMSSQLTSELKTIPALDDSINTCCKMLKLSVLDDDIRLSRLNYLKRICESLYTITKLSKYKKIAQDAEKEFNSISTSQKTENTILSNQAVKEEKIKSGYHKAAKDYIDSGKDPQIVKSSDCPDVIRDALNVIKGVHFDDVYGIDYRKGGFFSHEPRYILYTKTGIISNYDDCPKIKYDKIASVELGKNGVYINTTMGKRIISDFKKSNQSVYNFITALLKAIQKIRLLD